MELSFAVMNLAMDELVMQHLDSRVEAVQADILRDSHFQMPFEQVVILMAFNGQLTDTEQLAIRLRRGMI